MGLNIAITSKYDPFTYEDYIKPLEGYWEEYDKHEADLDKLATDTATLKEVINSMPEGEEKTKYTGYLQSLDAQAGSLATSGLNSANRKALRDLKNQYSSLMPRLALAEEARRKDLADYTKRVNSGEYFMYNDSPLNKNVVDYLDGNLPTYNAGLNKQLFGQEVENVAKAYSNRIFNDVDVQEVEKIGRKFLKLTEEKGINTDLSDIEGSEQFSPILEELYAEAGVDNMTQTEAAKTKDFINRKFWEGLIYQKAVDFKNYKAPQDDSKNTVPTVIGKTIHGEDIIKYPGAGTWIVDKNGLYRRYDSTIDSPESDKPTKAEQKEITNAQIYYSTHINGADIYSNENIGSGKSDKIKEIDETWVKDNQKLFGKYLLSLTEAETVKPRYATQIVTKDTNQILLDARKNANDKDKYDTYVLGMADDQIIFRSGNGAELIEDSKTKKKKRGEWFGDNHIRIIDTTTFFNWLDLTLKEEDFKSRLEYAATLKDILTKYANNPNHNAYKKALERLKKFHDKYEYETFETFGDNVYMYLTPNTTPGSTPVTSGGNVPLSSGNED